MVQLNLLEKITNLLEIVKSSSLFIIAFMIAVTLITVLIIGYKKNKKVNTKLIIGSFVMLITFVIIKYSTSLISLLDNFVEEVITAIYFPNLAVYLTVLVSINAVTIYTLIKNKFYFHKLSSAITTILIDFLFIMTLDVVIENNIDIYKKLDVYSNQELLVLIELTTLIFTAWVLITGFVKIVNRTVNSNIEVPEMINNSVKEIPAYVIPTPVGISSNQFINDALYQTLEPIKNSTYQVNYTGSELYNMFKSGEDLTADQYKELKNYLMTR